MSAAGFSRFDELVSRYLDNALTDADAAELAASLAEPELAVRFLEMTRLNSEIAGLLAAPVPDAAMAELVRADIEKHLAGAQPAGAVRLRINPLSRGSRREEAHSHSGEGSQSLLTSAATRFRGRRALAWAAAFIVFAGLAALFFFKGVRVADAPLIASVQGEVRLVGPNERGLTPGDSWRRGERLKTVGTGSAATLKFRDGSQLDFGGSTVAVNEPSGGGFRVQLDHGTVQAALKPQPAHHPFIFATPEAEAIVVGTKLRLVTGGHRTRLEVIEGEVRFRRRHDGAEVAVKAGQYAVVAPNAAFVAAPLHPDPHAVH